MDRRAVILRTLERSLLVQTVICLIIMAATLVHRSILPPLAMRESHEHTSVAAPSNASPVCQFEGDTFSVRPEKHARHDLMGVLLLRRSPLATLRNRNRSRDLTLISTPGDRDHVRGNGYREHIFRRFNDAPDAEVVDVCREDRGLVFMVNQAIR
jgi:hypothetical protein